MGSTAICYGLLQDEKLKPSQGVIYSKLHKTLIISLHLLSTDPAQNKKILKILEVIAIIIIGVLNISSSNRSKTT